MDSAFESFFEFFSRTSNPETHPGVERHFDRLDLRRRRLRRRRHQSCFQAKGDPELGFRGRRVLRRDHPDPEERRCQV